MDWIERANKFTTDYHGLIGAAGATASVVSAGITVVGYFQDRSERRKILGQLAAIREYMMNIDIKVDNLLNQNKQILEALDALPDKFYHIAVRVVQDSEVDKSYSFLRGLRNTFYDLNGERFELTSGFWRDVSQLLTYVYEHEDRLSYNATLASFGEFAIALTGGAATGFVSDLVSLRISRLEKLHPILESEAASALGNLQNLIKQSEYIQSHNFGEGPFSNLSIKYMPDRMRTVTRHREECHEENDFECCRGRVVCHQVPYSVSEPDIEFSNRRNAYKVRVDTAIKDAKSALKNVFLSSWAKSIFIDYHKVLTDASFLKESLESGAFSLVPGLDKSEEGISSGSVRVVEKIAPDDKDVPILEEKRTCY